MSLDMKIPSDVPRTHRFLGVEIELAPGVLIPRQETELLGRTAIAALQGKGERPLLVDVCCGSGNLACAIAHQVPDLHAWACDLTDPCVALARRNVARLDLTDRVEVLQGDLFAPLLERNLVGKIDCIVCNPPYISSGKLAGESAHLLEREPREAFDGGPYGLTIQQRVIREAAPLLRSGGILLLEFGLGQKRQVELLFGRARTYEAVTFVSDATGAPRVVRARKSVP
jgi:release factor glutamine methyltransferase